MVKTIRLLKVALKNSILTDKVKYESIHSHKCTIDLDSQDEDLDDSFSVDSVEDSHNDCCGHDHKHDDN